MKTKLFFALNLAAVIFIAGCASPIPPGAERGPNGTMAFDVLVEASSPGVRIEANGQYAGETPTHIKIFGDPDGTFHDVGSPYYEVRALPTATNQFMQMQAFRTGQMFSGEDKIPSRIYFDMNQPPPVYVPYPVYGYRQPTYYGSPYYESPYYYERPYYGPTFHFGFGTRIGSDYYGGHSDHSHGHSSGGGLPGLPVPRLPGLPHPGDHHRH